MPVALKVLAPELGSDDTFRERFLREAQTAATIDHPNVIPIHDMGLHEDSLYIVMRFVAGGDLKALLGELGPLDAQLTLSILTPIAQALDAAHAHGLVHRDVKPANVLLARSSEGAIEHVYLTDFGIAKSATFSGALTSAGASIGTVGYMAPEQLEGREVTAQTDVYALTVTLYECLTGRVPFQRELAEGIRPPVGEVEPLSRVRPDLPAALDAIVVRGLSRDLVDRFATCEQLLSACREAVAGHGAPAASSAAPAPLDAIPATELAGETPGSALAQRASMPTEDAAAPPASGRAPSPSAANGRQTARRGGRAWLVGAIGAIVVAAAAAAIVITSGSGSGAAKGKLSQTALAEVPTNRVTGSGEATVRLDGDSAEITVTTNGLDNGGELVHLMHIHGGGKGECPPASAARLHNNHLAISTTDGINYYGPPVQALTTHGDTSVASILAFRRFPSGGNLHYSRTIVLPAKVAAEVRADDAVIVVHGTDYDGSGIYSGVLDASELSKSVPANGHGARAVRKAGRRAERHTRRPRRARWVLLLGLAGRQRRAQRPGGDVDLPRGRLDRSRGRFRTAQRLGVSEDPLAKHSLSAAELKRLLAAERAGEAFLAFRDERGELCLFAVSPSPQARDSASTVGRRAEADLSLAWDTEVSGLHAELHHIGGEWAVVDDGLSTNGTYVNGQRIAGRQRLRDGDRVRVGRTVLAYKAAQATLVQETVAAADLPSIELTEAQRRVLVALCRPYREGSYATPATNQQIAGELFLSVDAVKMHLRTLFGKFQLGDLPQNQKRAKLAERALQFGVISPRDLA
jgi:hypothetical protein